MKEARAKRRLRVSTVHTGSRQSVNWKCFVSVLQGDNLRSRALDNMMGGALEGKKEDVLHMVGHIIHMPFFSFLQLLWYLLG